MIYKKLLNDRIIEPCEVSDEEIADHLRTAQRDIDVAQDVEDLDLDWAFTIAYNGILQTALSFMYSKGYRPRGEGKHLNTFKFLSAALPKELQGQIGRVQKLRKKRNQAVYRRTGVVSETEAKDIIAFSHKFHEEIVHLLPNQITNFLKEES